MCLSMKRACKQKNKQANKQNKQKQSGLCKTITNIPVQAENMSRPMILCFIPLKRDSPHPTYTHPEHQSCQSQLQNLIITTKLTFKSSATSKFNVYITFAK